MQAYLPTRLAALAAGLFALSSPACDAFSGDEGGPTGDPCVDYVVTDWWPDDGGVYEPWQVVDISHVAGGKDGDGVGVVIQTELLWDGLVYGSLDSRTSIGMPKEPGTYTVRAQALVCPDLYREYTFEVAHPAQPAEAAALPLTRDDLVGYAVAWWPDGSTLGAVLLEDGPNRSVRVEIDVATEAVTSAFECVGADCGVTLDYSDDGRWMAAGAALYERRDGAWFLFTHLPGAISFAPGSRYAFTDDGFRVSLDDGEHLRFAESQSVRQVIDDDRVVLDLGGFDNGLVAEVETGELHPVNTQVLESEVEHWLPGLDRAVISDNVRSATSLRLASTDPPLDLQTDRTGCLVSFKEHRVAADPQGTMILMWGATGSEVATSSPWFQTCRIRPDLSELDRRRDAELDVTGLGVSATVQRTRDAAFSPDGARFATAGLTGVFIHDKADYASAD